jgi:hypothetical protein
MRRGEMGGLRARFVDLLVLVDCLTNCLPPHRHSPIAVVASFQQNIPVVLFSLIVVCRCYIKNSYTLQTSHCGREGNGLVSYIQNNR